MKLLHLLFIIVLSFYVNTINSRSFQIDYTNRLYIVEDRSSEIYQFDGWCDLYLYLQKDNIPYPEIWTQIAILESGWSLESGLAREGNNIFGFIYVNDSTRNVGSYMGYSKYKSHIHAIQDLKLRLKHYPMSFNESPYVYLQRTGYNSDPRYYQLLQQIQFWNKPCP